MDANDPRFHEDEVEEDEIGTQPVLKRSSKKEKTMAEEVKVTEEEEQRAAASQEYVDKMAEADTKVEEPPPEAAAHEGLAPYRLVEDVNIKHQDHKAGDVVPLTYEEYQSLRAVDVHCEQIAQPKV